MIIVMKSGATMKEVSSVLKQIEAHGFKPHMSKGEETTVIGVIGDERKIDTANFQTLPGVEKVIPILKPYKLASRDFQKKDTVVKVGDVHVGGGTFTVMAGPCAVESLEQTMECARKVHKSGAKVFRGGAFKPRTSPYAFQGLGKEGLQILAQARAETGLPVITEVMTVEDVPLVAEYADILQIGARNSQNFNLLDAAGRQPKPVLLKRGLSGTIEELLLSAEYILSRGNPNVILCERGIRTYEKATRNTLDISAVPVLKSLSHLPVVIDPSHATGLRHLVAPLAKAAVAVGADGVLIEVHPHPEKALCDGPQSLTPEMFDTLIHELRPIAKAVGLEMGK
ncbi:MAG TPA: 3-deoxy-7-phosphoheptulonate synthase [Planctomycetota bacterium]|nr:3-deoxy-7-phosphoheptulonate synthase [Planctomycetota bacterium]